MDKVLDPDYTPLTQENMNLPNEKQEFVHSVLPTTLRTDRAKKFVREHEGDFNAQMVHKKTYGFYETSVETRVSASSMFSYMTSVKFDSWKGTTESLIITWQDQIRLHESLVDADSYF